LAINQNQGQPRGGGKEGYQGQGGYIGQYGNSGIRGQGGFAKKYCFICYKEYQSSEYFPLKDMTDLKFCTKWVGYHSLEEYPIMEAWKDDEQENCQSPIECPKTWGVEF